MLIEVLKELLLDALWIIPFGIVGTGIIVVIMMRIPKAKAWLEKED